MKKIVRNMFKIFIATPLLLTSCDFFNKYLNINDKPFSNISTSQSNYENSSSTILTDSQIEELINENLYDLSQLVQMVESNLIDIDLLIQFLQTKLLENELQITSLLYELQIIRDELKNHNESSESGRELLFSFPIAGQPYLSDHTFVGNELWFFIVSNDNHTGYSKVLRYEIDFTNMSAIYLGNFEHNFGHCNTVDYCEETNTLIMGNGGGSENQENDQIYIFSNAGEMKENERVVLNQTAIIIDLDENGLDWGKQVNVCWGESNNGKYNIAYAMSNDGTTKTIRKLLLGQGNNKLDYGVLMAGSIEKGFNGTFNVLHTWQTPYSYDICNQGSDWYRGKLYEGIGHDGMWHHEHEIGSRGIKTKENQEFFYNDDGTKRAITTEGIAIKNGFMVMANIPDYRAFIYRIH